MAYVSPTIAASSQTFANLRARGFHGYIASCIAAQSNPTARSVELCDNLVNRIAAGKVGDIAEEVVTTWTQGNPVSQANEDTNLQDLCFAFKLIATAIDEIGVLVDANTGTLGYDTTPPIYAKYRRTFP